MLSYQDFVDHLLPGESIQGWLHSDEATMLARSAQCVPRGGRIVEIGSYRGLSTLLLGYGSHNGNKAYVYAVDSHPCIPFSPSDVRGPVGVYGAGDLVQYYKSIAASPYSGLVRTINLDSNVASMAFNDRTIDMVFIDGSHEYHDVLLDLAVWAPKVTPGGLLMMHDSQFPGVARAIQNRPHILHPAGRVQSLAAFVQDEAGGYGYVWPLDLLGPYQPEQPSAIAQ